MVLSGQTRKSAPTAFSLLAEASISSPTRPVAAVDTGHVFGQREGVHRDLGMCMRAEDRRTLDADCAVTQGRACRYELALMEEQANWRSASGLAG